MARKGMGMMLGIGAAAAAALLLSGKRQVKASDYSRDTILANLNQQVVSGNKAAAKQWLMLAQESGHFSQQEIAQLGSSISGDARRRVRRRRGAE